MAANTFFRYDLWVKSAQGPAVPGAQIYVVNQPANVASAPPSPLASVFSDSGGLIPITQPILTDGFGHANFYALAGLYTVVVALNGVIQQVYPDQSLGGVGTTGGGGGGISGSLLLQVNGIANANQFVLNLQGANSISVVDQGNGTIAINGPLFKTNGITNPLQSVLNLTGTGGTSVTSDVLGNITINSPASSGGGVLGKWPGNWIGSNASGYTGSGDSTSTAGNMGMNFQQVSAQPQVIVVPTATVPAGVTFQSSSISTASGFIDRAQNDGHNLTTGILQDWFMSAQIVGTTQSRYFIGITDTTQGNVATVFFSDTPNANFIGFRWSSGTDGNIKAMCSTNSSNITVVDTGVATLTARHIFEIVPSGTSIKFYIDGTLVATINTNVPSNTTALTSIVTVDAKNSGASNSNITFNYVYALLTS